MKAIDFVWTEGPKYVAKDYQSAVKLERINRKKESDPNECLPGCKSKAEGEGIRVEDEDEGEGEGKDEAKGEAEGKEECSTVSWELI